MSREDYKWQNKGIRVWNKIKKKILYDKLESKNMQFKKEGRVRKSESDFRKCLRCGKHPHI